MGRWKIFTILSVRIEDVEISIKRATEIHKRPTPKSPLKKEEDLVPYIKKHTRKHTIIRLPHH
jgi:hypothetical protein